MMVILELGTDLDPDLVENTEFMTLASVSGIRSGEFALRFVGGFVYKHGF